PRLHRLAHRRAAAAVHLPLPSAGPAPAHARLAPEQPHGRQFLPALAPVAPLPPPDRWRSALHSRTSHIPAAQKHRSRPCRCYPGNDKGSARPLPSPSGQIHSRTTPVWSESSWTNPLLSNSKPLSTLAIKQD